MKKFVVSTILGLVLSAIPVSMYAACASEYTVDLGSAMRHCVLTGSSGGGTICYYSCHNIPKDGPAPVTPPQA